MADAGVIDLVPTCTFVGIVVCVVTGITPCIIVRIAESGVVNVVIISVFQAVGYLIGNTICVLPADECSDVGRSAIFPIVLGANGTVEQTVGNTVCTEWLNQIYPLIDELNRQGITWDWIHH